MEDGLKRLPDGLIHARSVCELEEELNQKWILSLHEALLSHS